MNFATTLYDNAPTLIDIGFDLLSNLVQGILDSLPILLAKAPEIVSKFANIINDNAPTILKKGVELVWQIVKGIIQAIPTLVQNIPKIITAIVDVWEAFNWVNLGKKALTLLKDGIMSMVGAVKSAGKNVAESVTGALKNLPSNLKNIGKNALTNLGSAIRSGANVVKSAATNILNNVVNTIKSLPSKMLGIGKDLVRGLWNGISDMSGWVIGKIQSFGDTVLDGIKNFFGIKSPSRVFRDQVGKMLAAGMAEGIEENADQPLDALNTLANDMTDEVGGVDGMAIERQISHSYRADAAAAAMQSTDMLSKLDQILEAIKRGQILTINGDTLVGATANAMNSALGQRRMLAERGAV
jgi:phage-related protein